MEKILIVEGMSCKHCAAAVTNALQHIDGVKKVKVELESKTVRVKVSTASDSQLTSAITDAGYKVVSINE